MILIITGPMTSEKNKGRLLLPSVVLYFLKLQGFLATLEEWMHEQDRNADSPAVRTVDLTFWKDGIPNTQLEIPVEVTRIACVDPIEIRTVGGTIYATASEGDMIESKVIAILGRTILRHRDIVDVFLFQDRFRPDSAKRLKSKLFGLSINNSEIEKRICDLQENSDYHSKTIQEVIDSQLDLEAAAQLNDCGGGKIILDTVISLLSRYISLEEPNEGN